MSRYERSIYTHPDPKKSSRSEEKEERRRADERSLAPYEKKAAEMEKRSGGRGGRGGGGGGMNPIDLERVPGKRPLRFEKGGKVSSASKRADGCVTKGKTKGKML